MKSSLLGLLTLAIAILALGLAVIPGIALDRPPPIFARPPEPEPESEPKFDRGVTLRHKSFSITFGTNRKAKEESQEAADELAEPKDEVTVAASPPAAQISTADQMMKGLTLASACCSLLGMVLGSIALNKEKQPALSGTGMFLAFVALTWQYIVFGIAVGVAIAIIFMLLSAFA